MESEREQKRIFEDASKEVEGRIDAWSVSSGYNLREIDLLSPLIASRKQTEDSAGQEAQFNDLFADHHRYFPVAPLQVSRVLDNYLSDPEFFVYAQETGEIFDSYKSILTAETTYESKLERLRGMVAVAGKQFQNAGEPASIEKYLSSPSISMFGELISEMSMHSVHMIKRLVLFLDSSMAEDIDGLPLVQGEDEVPREVRIEQSKAYWTALWQIFDRAKKGSDDLEVISRFLDDAETKGYYADKVGIQRFRSVPELIDILSKHRLFKFSTQTHGRFIKADFPGKKLEETDTIHSKFISIDNERVFKDFIGSDITISTHFSLRIPLSLAGVRMLLEDAALKQRFANIEQEVAAHFIEIVTPLVNEYISGLTESNMIFSSHTQVPSMRIDTSTVQSQLFAALQARLPEGMLAETSGNDYLEARVSNPKKYGEKFQWSNITF